MGVFFFYTVPLLAVVIEHGKGGVSANKLRQVTCRAFGSSPRPRLTWWKAGVRLQASHESVRTSFSLLPSLLFVVVVVVVFVVGLNSFINQANSVPSIRRNTEAPV